MGKKSSQRLETLKEEMRASIQRNDLGKKPKQGRKAQLSVWKSKRSMTDEADLPFCFLAVTQTNTRDGSRCRPE